MHARLAALLVATPLLTGCLVIRAGGGATFGATGGGPGGGPGRYDAELGLVVPTGGRAGRWLLSALAVHRERRAEDAGWTLLALEVARPLYAMPEGPPDLSRSLGWALPSGLRDLGLRLELGRSERGGYLGGAAKSTLRVSGSVTLTGVLSAGVNTGPEHGPSAGLHLLFGFN